MQKKKTSILVLLLVTLLLLVGCTGKDKVEEYVGLEGVYKSIEGITPRQEHMGYVLNTVSGSEKAAIVSEKQEGYKEIIDEMGLDAATLREFALYQDDEKVYIVIDTELGMEAKVFEDVGNYIMERNHRELDEEEHLGEEVLNERLYITSIGDYMVVILDENPESVAIEIINGLMDVEYPIKSSARIQTDNELELERQEDDKELEKEIEADWELREKLELEKEEVEKEE